MTDNDREDWVYIKVQRPGNTRSLALGRFIPNTWHMVRATLLAQSEDSITLQLRRVASDNESNAPSVSN